MTPATPPASDRGKQWLGPANKPAGIRPTPGSGSSAEGYPAKPASIGPRGGTLYESQPQLLGTAGAAIGGATGATAGGVAGAGAGAVTVPGVGAVPGAVLGTATGAYFGAETGAGFGGLLGRYVQYLEQRAVGGTKVGDFLGIPPLGPEESTHTVAGEMGAEATAQIENEAVGQLIAAPLGWLFRGGWLKYSRQVMDTVRANAARGTRLSGPEIASGTRIGEVGKSFQAYSAGSFAGGPMQQRVREQGTTSAMKELDGALAAIWPRSSNTVTPGMAAAQGIKDYAKAGQRVVGKQLEQLARNAPTVDMRPVKQEVVNELEQSIAPRIAAFPDIVKNKKVAALVRALRNDPTTIQRMPRPDVTLLVDALLEKTNSPTLQMLREILGAEDDANFRGVWKQQQVLRKGATPIDQLYAKGDVQRLATRFKGLFREALSIAEPAWDAPAQLYESGARVLESRAIKTILKTAVDKPEAVVGLFKENPTKAAMLQRALKAVAGRGPEAARASAAYDLIRSSYLRQEIILGGKAMPTTEDGMDEMLQGIKQRLSAERQSGVLPQWFSDVRGRHALANLDQIADLMSKRSKATTGRLRQIFEISRGVAALTMGGVALASGRSLPTSTVVAAVAWEGLPDFLVWVMHDPRATKWFIEGTTATNPTVASAGVVRLMELYRLYRQ